eukprot:CAMPEP_0205814962 /NCGR_PEP_ID=MMETSP0205-20121125/20383_1 /ASSEMBLY_ACC=CAM_ASM_000278 /TAXON_ID=36767 /ORGANISM="Euplotes focardii, Strain TN1" /LENGTH=148 /DNA_ID=CAMNT_0053100099 /DNA_START=411 /DNA_END=857 /DNA_ORIENTATION=-
MEKSKFMKAVMSSTSVLNFGSLEETRDQTSSVSVMNISRPTIPDEEFYKIKVTEDTLLNQRTTLNEDILRDKDLLDIEDFLENEENLNDEDILNEEDILDSSSEGLSLENSSTIFDKTTSIRSSNFGGITNRTSTLPKPPPKLPETPS